MNDKYQQDEHEEGEEKRKRYPLTWVQFLLFVAIYLGVYLGGVIVISSLLTVISFVTGNRFVDVFFVGFPAIYFSFSFLVISLLIYKPARTFVMQSFSWQPLKKPSTLVYMIVGLVLMYLIQIVFFEWLGLEDPSEQQVDLGLQYVTNGWLVVLFYLAIAILTPFEEEVLFRGLLHRFLESRHFFWLGFVVSSLIFGFLHVGFPITATLAGVIFVLLYKLTNSLWPPILLHVLWNAYVSTVLLYLS
jgi:membrane protease YdiL (CAAX protease family)